MTNKAEGQAGSELIGSVRPGEEAHWCVVGNRHRHHWAKECTPTEEDAVRRAEITMQCSTHKDGPVRWWVRVGRKGTVLRASRRTNHHREHTEA